MDRYSVTLILFFIHFSREDVILVDRYSVTFFKRRCNNLRQKATYLFSQDQTCARNRGEKIISSSFNPPFVSNRKTGGSGKRSTAKLRALLLPRKILPSSNFSSPKSPAIEAKRARRSNYQGNSIQVHSALLGEEKGGRRKKKEIERRDSPGLISPGCHRISP